MRIVFSKKIKDLEKIVFPHMELVGLDYKLKENVPEDIRKKYSELMKLMDEEIKAAEEV